VEASNSELKTQLGLYTDKFVMFDDALTRSDSMFTQFEQKINNLDSTIDKMSQEKEVRKEICCTLDLNLFNLLDEKSKPGKEVSEAQAKKESLQNECRALQQKRTALIKRKKEKEIQKDEAA
jgi:hypothetical protein